MPSNPSESQKVTNQGTRDPGDAAPLSPDDQKDILSKDDAELKTITKATSSGARLRAIPSVITHSGDTGSMVEVTKVDFADNGITHDTVQFTFAKDNFVLEVGDGKPLSKEAADLLVKKQPQTFEYVNDGVSES